MASGRSAAGVLGENAFWARDSAFWARTKRLSCCFAALAWVAETRPDAWVEARAGVLSVVASSATTLATTATSSSAGLRRALRGLGMRTPSLFGEFDEVLATLP